MKIKKVLSVVLFLAVALLVVQPYSINQKSAITFPGTVIVSSASAVVVTGVTINKKTASLKVAQILQLTATIAPAGATDKTVKWSSSNVKVATVSSTGKVTAKAVGSAKITVKTTDGSKTASCAVTVLQPVTSVKLSKTSLALLVGKASKLIATINPTNASNKKVTWKSSSPAIAAVSALGVITAKAKGTAAITVTSVDGKKTAKCNVTVK